MMKFELTSINTQYNNTDAIAAIAKENTDAAYSNVASLYEASEMDIDGAILSISNDGYARINAMLNRSIQLCTNAASNVLSPADRVSTTSEINYIRIELGNIREEDAEKMVEESADNIIKHASESIKTQTSNRGSVLQLL